MAAPYEILGAPLTLYLAPVGTTMPAIDEEEATFDPAWFKVGTSGDKNYSEEGVSVSHEQALNYFRGAGATAPRKAFRQEEDLTFGVTIADVSPGQYAKAINDATVTTVAAGVGTTGEKSLKLWRGLTVATFALFARGLSSVDDALYGQYEVATCIEDGSPAPVYTKGEPAMLGMQFRALDASGDGTGFGVLRIGTAVPTS